MIANLERDSAEMAFLNSFPGLCRAARSPGAQDPGLGAVPKATRKWSGPQLLPPR